MKKVLAGSPANGDRLLELATLAERKSAIADMTVHNKRQAAVNRAYFDDCGVLVINLMSSPGAGKTALLEATIDALKDEFSMAVIEGDVETENDARRIRAKGVPALQITTGGMGHLDAAMVCDAMHHLAPEGRDILFIENIGNLVSPADFDLGQHCSVTLLSVPEGDDKFAKYPKIFRAADLVLLTKTDMLHFMRDFSPRRAEQGLRALGSTVPLLGLSARDGGGLDIWFNWLRREVAAHRARLALDDAEDLTLQPGSARGLSAVPDSGPLRHAAAG